MTAQDMPEAVAEDKVSRILRARAFGEAQGDFEAGAHLGAHPDNADREAKAEAEARDRLASLIARVERLNEEKKALQSDISDLFKEAKASGHHVGAMKAVIRRRAMDPADADELDRMIDLYRAELEG